MGCINESKQTLIFTYATLKQGFANHCLMQDLINQNDAVCLGRYITHQPYPLVCGPYNTLCLINLAGSGKRVKDELYSVSTQGLARLDELEGTSFGHYDRLLVEVESEEDGVRLAEAEAEAHFANGSFGERLWAKKGKVELSEYSEKDGRDYLKMEERAKDSYLLDDLFLPSQ